MNTLQCIVTLLAHMGLHHRVGDPPFISDRQESVVGCFDSRYSTTTTMLLHPTWDVLSRGLRPRAYAVELGGLANKVQEPPAGHRTCHHRYIDGNPP
eukprot:4098670-Pyramimonas_sp.AAC.1